MDGTQFGELSTRDMSRMLSPSPDGVYRGLDHQRRRFRRSHRCTAAEQLRTATRAPVAASLPGRYLFDDKAKIPAMTYSQLQFIKAEAAYRMGNKALALTAYINAISAHIDFVNARNSDNGQTPTQITRGRESSVPGVTGNRSSDASASDADAHHVPEVHRPVGVGA